MTFWRKWSFLAILLFCGAVFFMNTDVWAAAGEPARAAKDWFDAVFDRWEDMRCGEPSAQEQESEEPVSEVQAAQPEETIGTEELPEAGGTEAEGRGTEENTENSKNGMEGGSSEEAPAEITFREPSEVTYMTVEDDYFADAVFIGDSRMVGMYEYGNLEEVSTFYVSTGLTIFKLFDSEIVEVEGERKKITVEQALSERQFSKIYLEVGINEMGTGDLERFLNTYRAAVDHLRELQPDAVIYLQAIMKVTKKRSDQGDYINNEGIEARNQGIAAIADNVHTYYLDVNPYVCDESGALNPTYTFDGVHLKGKDVIIWKNFLKEHAVSLDGLPI